MTLQFPFIGHDIPRDQIIRRLYYAAATLVVGLVPLAVGISPVSADSSSPVLAAYYNRQMAIVNGVVYAWQGNTKPKRLAKDAVQVGVGRSTYYVLTGAGKLLAYDGARTGPETVMSDVANFAAGRSGVLVISTKGALWWIAEPAGDKTKIADNVATAAVGDGANYYISNSGDLFVKGKAHRGQYGDGLLKTTGTFVRTASDAARISAHTGHAILLQKNGDVLGTGGNIYGPVGRHGLGDKAILWSKILSAATAIATGSSHTVAILHDGTLMAWGSEYGPDPVAILGDVTAVAAGSSTTIAMTQNGILWQWGRGEEPRSISLE